MLLTTTTIRPLTPDDLPQVANLWNRVFRKSAAPASDAILASFRDVFFHNPWLDPDLPSLIYENRHGIAGFLGVIPRPMLFGTRPIRAAVATQLMVDPARQPGFAALELIRQFLAGPQDLSYSDGANDASRRVWQRGGGDVSTFYSMEWVRPLRPAQYLRQRLGRHVRGLPGALLRPVDFPLSYALLRSGRRRTRDLRVAPLDTQLFLEHLPRLAAAQSLRPHYTPASIRWLLDQCGQTRSLGALRSMAVQDAAGEVLGWFIYLVAPGQFAHVLHLAATDATSAPVLDCLFLDAWHAGATAVSGQMDPRFLRGLSDRWCFSTCPGIGVLVHSRHPELLLAIHRGDAALTRLEGEWWLRFGIDRAAGW